MQLSPSCLSSWEPKPLQQLPPMDHWTPTDKTPSRCEQDARNTRKGATSQEPDLNCETKLCGVMLQMTSPHCSEEMWSTSYQDSKYASLLCNKSLQNLVVLNHLCSVHSGVKKDTVTRWPHWSWNAHMDINRRTHFIPGASPLAAWVSSKCDSHTYNKSKLSKRGRTQERLYHPALFNLNSYTIIPTLSYYWK